MMFIIADKDPEKAVTWLQENTSKTFYFKQLIELAQLICSTGLSNVYKKVNRGKEIQKWILENKYYTYVYFRRLWYVCMSFTNIKPKTSLKIYRIIMDLFDSLASSEVEKPVKTGIFRYKKEYESKFPSNSELPIRTCANEYRKYITTFKFPKEVKA